MTTRAWDLSGCRRVGRPAIWISWVADWRVSPKTTVCTSSMLRPSTKTPHTLMTLISPRQSASAASRRVRSLSVPVRQAHGVPSSSVRRRAASRARAVLFQYTIVGPHSSALCARRSQTHSSVGSPRSTYRQCRA